MKKIKKDKPIAKKIIPNHTPRCEVENSTALFRFFIG
jgi:hypothetical protein